jgi:hypothetical protein
MRTAEARETIGNLHRGKLVSEETRAKIRAAWARRKAAAKIDTDGDA